MHKKIEADLVSLAHGILQMKNKDDLFELHQKSHQIYEKLSILKYAENYLSITYSTENQKKDLREKINDSFEKKEIQDSNSKDVNFIVQEQDKVSSIEQKNISSPLEKVFDREITNKIDNSHLKQNSVKSVKNYTEAKAESLHSNVIESKKNVLKTASTTLEEELKNSISADLASDFFENAGKINQKKILDNEVLQNNIKVGLNDRIAFVKNLFNGSQEDFNRVLSQLNTFKTEKEARSFIIEIIKPDYNWEGKEDYQDRLLALIDKNLS